MADSSTAVSVTWTQPEFLNGVLQSYTVSGLLSQSTSMPAKIIPTCVSLTCTFICRACPILYTYYKSFYFAVMPSDITRTVGADVLTAVVDTLSPYTEYTVFVVGITEEGGEGESSNIVTVTTLEDGKGVYILVFLLFVAKYI